MIRSANITRKTRETSIELALTLDGKGVFEGASGIGFLDHMLEQIARHGGFDLSLNAQGDTHIDAHHTVEDIGITFGQAIKDALGDKKGMTRYGHAYVPMDEALSRVAIDLSGRAFLVWKVEFTIDRLGPDMETELFREFFQGLSQSAGMTLHVENLYAINNHHRVESIFKAFARALRIACSIDPANAQQIPSTKGVL
jgi:imidazoleglycerol-phosphate dehydratase